MRKNSQIRSFTVISNRKVLVATWMSFCQKLTPVHSWLSNGLSTTQNSLITDKHAMKQSSWLRQEWLAADEVVACVVVWNAWPYSSWRQRCIVTDQRSQLLTVYCPRATDRPCRRCHL